MKTEKILFMCNTPYQLLMASNIAWTRYNGKSIEVIVSNHFNSKKIVENINITKNIFSKAYYVILLRNLKRVQRGCCMVRMLKRCWNIL